MSTTIDADANANSGGVAAVPSTWSYVDIDGPTNNTGTILADIGAATLRADTLTVEAIISNVSALAEADSVAGALGVDSDGTAETRVKLAADVLVRSGAQLEGKTSVSLKADQTTINVKSDALGSAVATNDINLPSPFGKTGASTTTSFVSDSNVTTQGSSSPLDASRIATKTLNITANAPASPSIVAKSEVKSAIIGDSPKSESVTRDLDRTIDFNSDVFIVNISPNLEIAADGSVVNSEGITFTDDGSNATKADGTTITIDPISNTGTLAGEINLTIGSVSVSGTSNQTATHSTIKGSP
ncbi:MAG: hypothetical protein GY722_24800, partial [bacterium]|nr:hypothetical protein [bacterium]